MKIRLLIAILLFLVLVLVVFFSPSYRLSREAKGEFENGDFEKAYALATQALQKDPYNRQAFSVQNNAKSRKNIQAFLKATNENFTTASRILSKPTITPQEFLQLRWIVDEFNKNLQTLLLLNAPNEQESKEIENYKKWFKTLELRLQEAKKLNNA